MQWLCSCRTCQPLYIIATNSQNDSQTGCVWDSEWPKRLHATDYLVARSHAIVAQQLCNCSNCWNVYGGTKIFIQCDLGINDIMILTKHCCDHWNTNLYNVSFNVYYYKVLGQLKLFQKLYYLDSWMVILIHNSWEFYGHKRIWKKIIKNVLFQLFIMDWGLVSLVRRWLSGLIIGGV